MEDIQAQQQQDLGSTGGARLTERQAQQRAAVLLVIGSEAPAAPEPITGSVDTDVETQDIASLPVVTPPQPEEPAPPAPVQAAEPAPPAPSPKPGRHWLSKFVHRHAIRRRLPQPHQTHPVAAHRRHYLRWVGAILAVAVVTPAAAWAAIYRFGADGPAARAVASLLPLQAGRVDGRTLTLAQLYARLEWHPRLNASPLAAVAPVDEGSKAAAFQAWVDEQLVRAELVSRGRPVTAEQLTAEQDRVQRGIGSSRDLAQWVQSTYGVGVPEFREAILRPTVERGRLAVLLAADRQRYAQAWEQAEAASRVRGLVGMSDLGWVDAADVGPAVADVLAAASRDTRTAPVPTSAGLAVYRYSESATDEGGARFWHLWQLLFPLDPVADFLAQARPRAGAAYYLPR